MVKMAEVNGMYRAPLEYESSGEWILPTCNIGLELEVENLPEPDCRGETPECLRPWWTMHHEGSLRNNGSEYVLEQPLFGKDLANAIHALDDYIRHRRRQNPDWFQNSSRTSLHVHLDIRDLDTTDEMYSLFTHYLIVERSLFRYFNDEREDNIFCLPFYRTWGAVDVFRHLLGEDPITIRKSMTRQRHERDAGLFKYSAFNALPMFQIGSVEFRHAPALFTYHDIREWINIIMCLKRAASIKPLRNKDIGHEVSAEGIESFYRTIFTPEIVPKLIFEDTHFDALEGVRLGQQVENAIEHEELKAQRNEVNKLAKIYSSNPVINRHYLG